MNSKSVKPKSENGARVSLIVPKALARGLRAQAKREKRSLNAQAIVLLQKALEDHAAAA